MAQQSHIIWVAQYLFRDPHDLTLDRHIELLMILFTGMLPGKPSDVDAECEDRQLAIINVKRLTPTSNTDDRMESHPTLAVGYSVHPEYLVGTGEGSHSRYRDKVLFSIVSLDPTKEVVVVNFDGRHLTLHSGPPVRVVHTDYGEFELQIVRFTSRKQLHRENEISG
jgi:hypothetical protein